MAWRLPLGEVVFETQSSSTMGIKEFGKKPRYLITMWWPWPLVDLLGC